MESSTTGTTDELEHAIQYNSNVGNYLLADWLNELRNYRKQKERELRHFLTDTDAET